MSATGSLSPEVRRLASALAAAKHAAAQARASDPSDGGSANVDHAVLFAKGLPAKLVRQAAEAVGVGVDLERATSFWPRRWVLDIGTGQGSLRTRMAEAAARRLTESGYDAAVWYQVD